MSQLSPQESRNVSGSRLGGVQENGLFIFTPQACHLQQWCFQMPGCSQINFAVHWIVYAINTFTGLNALSMNWGTIYFSIYILLKASSEHATQFNAVPECYRSIIHLLLFYIVATRCHLHKLKETGRRTWSLHFVSTPSMCLRGVSTSGQMADSQLTNVLWETLEFWYCWGQQKSKDLKVTDSVSYKALSGCTKTQQL